MQIGVETSRAVENKRIFVVDDDEITRAVLQFMLHDENETHEVESFERALEKTPDGKPDLLIVSGAMAVARGVSIVAELKEKIPGVKILVVVESTSDENGKQCLKAGANSLLSKPLKVETVRERVDVLLGRRAGFALPLTVLKTS